MKIFASYILLALSSLLAALPAAAAPLPRIVAQPAPPGATAGIFVDSSTGMKFVPRGYNYIKLSYMGSCTTPEKMQHSTFMPGKYDPAGASAFLSQMKYDGFNVVRVFINPNSDYCGSGDYGIAGPAQSTGLHAPYVANFLDFLSKAKNYGIYVIPVINEFPQNAGYYSIANAGLLPDIEGYASFYMQPGYMQAKAAYAGALTQAVKNAQDGELLSAVFSWEIQNEIYVFRSQKPFSLTSGSVVTAGGLTYNMASPSDRQQALDASVVNWANSTASAIRSIDPAAMVSASVFTFQMVGKPGPNGVLPAVAGFDPGRLNDRDPARPITLRLYSSLSYTDFHLYDTFVSYSMLGDLNSSEFASMNRALKPILLGEFGAFKFRFPSLTNAAYAMGAFRDEAYSYGFAGSLFWTWDATIQTDLWHGAENSGAINGILAFPKY